MKNVIVFASLISSIVACQGGSDSPHLDASTGGALEPCQEVTSYAGSSFLVSCTNENCSCFRNGAAVSTCTRASSQCRVAHAPGELRVSCCAFAVQDEERQQDGGMTTSPDADADANADADFELGPCNASASSDTTYLITCAAGQCTCQRGAAIVKRCAYTSPLDCAINSSPAGATSAGCCGSF